MTIKLSKLANKILLAFFASILALSSIPATVFADSFTYSYLNTYTVSPSDQNILVTQAVTIKSASTKYKISKGTEWEFVIPIRRDPTKASELTKAILPTIRVTDSNGKNISYTTSTVSSQIVVKAPLSKDIDPYQSQLISLSYKDPELYEAIGKVTNVYIPGLSEDTQFESTDSATGVKYVTDFKTRIQIPSSMETPSLITLNPSSDYTNGGYRVLDYTKDQILGRSVWIQFGKSQIYKFEISQKPVPQDTSEVEKKLGLSNNEYKIIIPSDASYADQKVLYESFSIEPKEVTATEEGNLVATFNLPADYKDTIKIDGYLILDQSKETNSVDRTGTFKDIPEDLKYLTNSAKYWEVDSKPIVDKAIELKGNSTQVIDVVEKTYDFIVSNINYDDKYVYGQPRERKGALKTLQGSGAVCMEYSDLFIALSRAQGIPARAAFGKGYDPNVPASEQVGHQWAQVWIPKVGWISIDTTWGESGRNFIGYDIDHALWFVREQDPVTPAEIEVTARSQLTGLEPPVGTFTPVSETPDNLLTQADVLNKYSKSGILSEIKLDSNVQDIFSKIPGSSLLIILLPSILIIVLVSGVYSLLKRAIETKGFLKKASKNETTLAQTATKEEGDKVRQELTYKDYELANPFNAEGMAVAPTTTPEEKLDKSKLEKFNITKSHKVEKAIKEINKPNKPKD